MKEHELKLAAEVAALNQMVDFLLLLMAKQTGLTQDQAAVLRDRMLRSWDGVGIPDVEASVSDHVSAETVEGIEAFWRRLLRHLPE